ncbi:AraC family transcriptional regulator [Actinocrispum sp. NPDC049592]|uniref:AraC family transcriptional regulator n=1 Tax=Actinocrispum sp. NPDC049592 TaxID=3154835 RepID=UPI0034486F21
MLWLSIPGLDQQVRLETGDVAVFDGNHEFTVSSDPGLDPVDATGLFAGRPLPIVHVGSGDEVASVGGHIDLGAAGGELLRAMPPLTYLHNWRMRLAQRTLRQDDTPLSTLARSLGYSSDSAFSNAFKRTVGVAPKRYRDAAKKAAV